MRADSVVLVARFDSGRDPRAERLWLPTQSFRKVVSRVLRTFFRESSCRLRACSWPLPIPPARLDSLLLPHTVHFSRAFLKPETTRDPLSPSGQTPQSGNPGLDHRKPERAPVLSFFSSAEPTANELTRRITSPSTAAPAPITPRNGSGRSRDRREPSAGR